MKRYYKTLSLLCLSSVLLSACKKEAKETPQLFPLDFYAQKLQLKTNLRLFTADGEIKDPLKIAKFAEDKELFKIEHTLNGTEQKMFSFGSKDKVLFHYTDTPSEFDVEQDGDRYLFISQKYGQLPPGFNDLTKNLFKYEIRQDIPSSTVYKIINVAYGDYKTLAVPMQFYYVVRKQQGNYQMSSGSAFNEINESFATTLKNQDTLAFKTYNLITKAK